MTTAKRTLKKEEFYLLLGNFNRVSNYKSSKNHHLITFTSGECLQSYNTFVAAQIGGQIYLTSAHDYSKTTAKFCTQYTGKTTAERRAGLADGSIILLTD